MNSTSSTAFADHLAGKKLLAAGAAVTESAAASQSGGLALSKLWERTDLTAGDFADEVAQFYNVPRVSLADMLEAPPLTKLFSRRFLREMFVFPYLSPDGQATLAAADPGDTSAIRAAEIVLGGQVTIKAASFDDINTILHQRLGEEDAASPVGMQPPAVRDDDIESLRDLASGAPVVRAVNDLLEKAVELRATDIHIEPFRAGLTVRMRVDGLLRAVPPPAGAPPQALVSRIKILSGLNIAERRLPQDGAARLRIGQTEIDVRVAIMPTQHGESAVLRLLPKDRGLLGIEKLGFRSADETKLRRLLAMPHGMIVITGPTGSGKTTTLATMLTVLNESTRKILTIEDPVEYEIAGINQSQIKPAISLSFASALRAFLRQDPDVIMVGEIRDPETAHIAVHAALTGHLVLTTLHTETAAAAVPRLIDLGVEGFLLKSTLRAVIAQRLVRQLCERCKTCYVLTRVDLEADPRYSAIGLRVGEEVYEPGGCEHCGRTGYRGRVGIFEVLDVNEDIRNLISAQSDSSSIDQAGVRSGMTTMIDDGLAKCRVGTTSAAEVLRVTTIR